MIGVVVRLRLVLRGVSPLIVRTIEVPDDVTLAVLITPSHRWSLRTSRRRQRKRIAPASGLVCGRFVRPRQVAFSTSCGVLRCRVCL